MGEFTSIYILGAYQRLGVGRALMSAGAHHLISEGIESAAVWVLKENVKAYNFYSALGAEDLTARDDFDSGFVITDVALGWKSIVCLL